MCIPTVRKCMIYCFSESLEKFLVFMQKENDNAGIQIPAGTIESNEIPHRAAVREFEEETGFMPPAKLHFLSQNEYDASQFKPEIHERYWFYTWDKSGVLPESWTYHESHAQHGDISYNYSWIKVSNSHKLIAEHGAHAKDALEKLIKDA